ncbi:hypothetical protein HPB51_000178 [Rhipicephalus microplus]|uniref:Fibronectin type-III domain-containing protein n=1 Tax=Rhipicephalus microplus TaxID=6941 RepID=A0A9J6E5M0_RHIMP|nr:hypothetical protein HPB51_000178 [Rhipicephalus microplus]
MGTSITTSWSRPEYRFDFYRLEMTEDKLDANGRTYRANVGSCAISKYARNETVTSCGDFEGCTPRDFRAEPRAARKRKALVPKVANVTLIDVGPDYFTVSWIKPAVSFDYYWVEVLYIGDESDMLTPHRISEYGPQTTVLPDLDNLTLVDIGPDHFTVSWMHPVAQFDYYWLEVYKRDDGSDTITPQRVGSCANGTIVHREQTQITCDMFKPCSNVTITLHTQAKGTSEFVSTGATLQGIFMPGKGIPEVVKLKQTAIAKNSVTLSWERPKGCFNDYLVTTSAENTELSSQETSAGTCGNGTIVSANETSVTCDGIRASSVSIMVQTRRLKSDGLISQGVTLQGIAMSKLVLPDVTNFSLIDVGPDSFTVSWARPSSYFDYYWVEVYDNSNRTDIPTPHRVGSCAYGNIIHRDQNQITCDKFKACVNASITVHAQSKGPSGLTSPGATLRGIFMPGRGLPEVRQLKLTEMDKDSITVSWQRPEGCFDGYIVEVAEENAGSSGVGGLSVGSCAGGISVDAEHTSITCRKIEACSVKITVRTQRKGPHELTSSGVSLHDIVMYKKAFVDFDLYLDRVTTTTAEIIIDPHLPPSCSPRYCGAYICRFYKSGAIVVGHHLSKLALHSNPHSDLQ